MLASLGVKDTSMRHSVKKLLNQKLSLKYFGPFLVMARVGKVAFRLQLPPSFRVHPTFHVSQLKKHIGTTPTQKALHVVDAHGTWSKGPACILDR
ncbi:hypothetical protein EPI10_009306 [Gossypium australe]|uniref:Tf2-1-like SH3-like domain-containing protein n=1 Tax=Gossypium australe TaxID=47621 RepID=A0A5B6U7A4_9ROSI|nr:hypothetical protein EPI10_009306 [Gossypium australe]